MLPCVTGEPISWQTRIRDGGWVEVLQQRAAGQQRFYVRVQPDRLGWLRLSELYLAAQHGEALTAEQLRLLRLGALEQLLNLPAQRAAIRQSLMRDAKPPTDTPRSHDGEDANAAQGTSVQEIPTEEPEPEPLQRPQRRPYPDGFYRDVAAAYRRNLRHGLPPNATLAQETGSPKTTIARWIKEARRRGYLGSGQQGRAGESGHLTIRYDGSPPLTLPHDDSQTTLKQGQTITLPIDRALQLLEDERTWTPAPSAGH
jgi:hypothetical protein